MGTQSILASPNEGTDLTIDQYWAKLKSHGFTPLTMRKDYAILIGPEGQPVGVPSPDNLSPSDRINEISAFLRTHMLN